MAENNNPIPIKKDKAYWQKLCDAWEASGLSQEAFCCEQSLVYSTFVYWRCKLRKRAGKYQAMDFMPVKLTGAAVSKTTLSCIEVVLLTGVKIRLPSDLNTKKLSALLKSMGS